MSLLLRTHLQYTQLNHLDTRTIILKNSYIQVDSAGYGKLLVILQKAIPEV